MIPMREGETFPTIPAKILRREAENPILNSKKKKIVVNGLQG